MKFEYDKDDSGIAVTRLSVSIVDFDWIFEPDNAKNFMLMLSRDAKKELFVTCQLRTFIKFMWQQY